MTHVSNTEDYFPAIVNSLPDLAIVIDNNGFIQCTNNAWEEFGASRECKFTNRWHDVNYLDVCDRSSATGNKHSSLAAHGIRQTISGKKSAFHFDYPCFAPNKEQWYQMRVHPLQNAPQTGYLILHQEITDTVDYINRLETLTLTDGLTGIGNRRCFDQALNNEWRRDTRAGNPMSLLLLDIDEFKLYNNQYGHIEGDTALTRVANALQEFARRPGDCTARYGGEEFGIVLGNTGIDSAINIAEEVVRTIRSLNIVHAAAAKRPVITVSVGIATTYPLRCLNEITLTSAADQKMYRSKRKGGNCWSM